MTSELQAIEFATSCAGGRAGESEARWIRNGLAAWLRSGCTKSLERCLHLPSTEKERKRMLRNFWIAEAAAQMPAASEYVQSKELEREFKDFLSRGPWKAWRVNAAPPPDASKLRAALFHIALNNRDGDSLSYRTFDRALKDTNCGGNVSGNAGFLGATIGGFF